MSMTRSTALIALALAAVASSCLSSDRPNSPTGMGAGGSGGHEDTGGSSATGGSTSTGGKATGGSSATGGSTSTGGSSNTGGSATGGSSGKPDAGADTATAAWPGCLQPVFSGVTPMDFCTVYATVCTFTGANHYTSMQDCMTKFHGMSSDGDACKSGHLCRASEQKDPAMRTADCASSGTGKCSN